MLERFSNGRKKQNTTAEAEKTVWETVRKINDINGLLELDTMQLREGEEIVFTLSRVNDQLSDIADALLRGQYAPQGELQRRMRRLEDEKAKSREEANKEGARAEALSGRIEGLRREKEDLSDQLNRQKKDGDSLREQLREAECNGKEYLRRAQRGEEEVKRLQEAYQKKEKGHLNTIRHMISFRDQLFSQLGYARASGDEKGIRIIEGILTILGDALRESGVTILDQAGEYDSKRQYIAGTAHTDNTARDMWIKETTKEGYLFEDKLIRQQEVVVFRCEDVAGSR